ncbi:MAG: S8 family serine peptidase, partial [Bacteroidota bacterium]
MSQRIYLVIIVLFVFTANTAISGTYRVFLKDKGPEKFEIGSSLYNTTLQIHSEKCLQRRAKVLKKDSLISISDAPVYNNYIEQIKFQGAKILLKLRWRNYLVVECDSLTALNIESLPFVRAVKPTGSKLFPLTSIEKNQKSFTSAVKEIFISSYSNCGYYSYGNSYNQANLMNVPFLHKLGIGGQDILLGVLDTGFGWRKHSATQNINVIAEHDFIFDDDTTSLQEPDNPGQENHGTAVLSTITGYSQGNLIGIAPSVSVMLAKTEDLRSETRIEEDNYAAGIEWL